MYKITIITEYLRSQLISFYRQLKLNFDTDYNCDEEIDEIDEDSNYEDDELNEDYDIEINYLNYKEKVEEKIIKKIKKSEYKNIIYLILLEDVYEFIKSKQISNIEIHLYESDILNMLENTSLLKLINLLNNDDEFLLDIFSLFYDYNINNSMEQKIKNKTLIKLTNSSQFLEKFKIYKFDDMQYYINKRRF